MGRAGLRTLLTNLLDEGQKFTYADLPKSSSGYPVNPQAFLLWAHRVWNILSSNFEGKTATHTVAAEGHRLAVTVERNSQAIFEGAKTKLIAGILQAIDTLEWDTTGDLVQEVGGRQLEIDSERIFVVHGRDHQAKVELEIFLREVGLDPVVLHRETDQGATLIEKFERHSNVGFAVILLTPDDRATVEDEQREERVELRARQNVILELGFFIGRLGRGRVCCIAKRGITVPSDLSGLTYKWFKEHVDEVKYTLLKELRAAGYSLAI